MKKEKEFFKLIGEKVDVFGKQVVYDKNFGNIDEVTIFVKNNVKGDANIKWELYTMKCSY